MRDLSFKKVVNFFAFIAVVLIALALLLFKLFPQVATIKLIGEIIAYIVTLIAAFNFVKMKRNAIITVIYAISATAIIALLIIA
ncbi:MAG: hypothetical protein WCR30_02870 [Clostridia bacterium]